MQYQVFQGVPGIAWYDAFLKEGETRLAFGKYGNQCYRWLIDNDLEYAQWVVMENKQMPRVAQDPFGQAAKWLERAFPLMKNPDYSFARKFQDVVRVAKLKAEAEEQKRQDDIRALKRLRKSTANGQLARLPQELLMHVVTFRGTDYYYKPNMWMLVTLPCVCQDLKRILGPLTLPSPRMTLMIADTFALLKPIQSKIMGGSNPNAKIYRADRVHAGLGVPNDPQYKRVWRVMQILASKTLIDLAVTEVGVARGSAKDYEQLAVRSMAQKATVLALRSSALKTMNQLVESRKRCQEMMERGYYTGTFDHSRLRQHRAATNSMTLLVDEVMTMKRQRQTLIDDLKEMNRINREHKLRLAIPGMFHNAVDEKKLRYFLDPSSRPS